MTTKMTTDREAVPGVHPPLDFANWHPKATGFFGAGDLVFVTPIAAVLAEDIQRSYESQFQRIAQLSDLLKKHGIALPPEPNQIRLKDNAIL